MAAANTPKNPSAQTTSVPSGSATMAPQLAQARNYHAWVWSWVEPYVSGAERLLDIGTGTTIHLVHFPDQDLVSVDIDEAATKEARARFATTRPGWRFETADITTTEGRKILGDAGFDVVFSSNVFEHIPDDAAAFRAARELLRPGGRLVLLLPAHHLLYGSLDRIAGHHRRYDKALLRRRFADAGMETEILRYVNATGALGWLANRFLPHRNIGNASVGAQIGLFDRAVPLLRWLEAGRRLPFGQSIVAVARR